MNIDLTRSIIEQINEWLVKTENCKSAREWSDEHLIEFVNLFLTEIDYGEHSNNSHGHKMNAYEDIAQNIINSSETSEFYAEKDEYKNDVLKLNNMVMEYVYRTHRYNCRFCGEYFKTEYKQGGYLTPIKEIKVGHFANSYPPKTECYIDKTRKYKIVMKSNKFIIANDLRGAFKDNSIDFDDNVYDICTPLGRINCTSEFSKKDMLCVNTGNTTINVFKNKDGLILTDMYYSDIDEYYFSDERKSNIIAVNNIIEDNKFKLKDSISCGLWWVMGASLCDINIDDISTDYTVYNVKKGTTYILEFDYHIGNFYKFYKAKDEDDLL